MELTKQYNDTRSALKSFSLYICLVVLTLLSGCQTHSVTFTAKATGHDREITIPLEVITQFRASPTIIVAHPSDGLDWSRYVGFWGSLIKSWGYNVVLPDSFTPRGFKNKEVMYKSGLVDHGQRAEDLERVAEWINKQSWHTGKIGMIGFSHGGGTVTRASNQTSLISVGVAYYPGCKGTRGDVNPRIPVQIHIGDEDTWTPSGGCVVLAKTSSLYDIYVYDGATHAFDIPAPTRVLAGYTLSHDPVATKRAEERTRLFFQKYLGQ
jgi:carboxymethylenebutenolidase